MRTSVNIVWASSLVLLVVAITVLWIVNNEDHPKVQISGAVCNITRCDGYYCYANVIVPYKHNASEPCLLDNYVCVIKPQSGMDKGVPICSSLNNTVGAICIDGLGGKDEISYCYNRFVNDYNLTIVIILIVCIVVFIISLSFYITAHVIHRDTPVYTPV
jgi:hypothetical protein